MTLMPGFRLGPYEILSPLGAGGMGEVYRARDSRLDRDVAIKVLPESVAGDPAALARFEREAKAVAALSHPNILALHDVGNDRGVAYAVTELLDGETLRDKLQSGAIPRAQAVDYGLQIARGLTAGHERAVVHRDLKPENLFVSKDGHVKILDFGLAKRDVPVAPGEETSAPTASGHTEPGTVMGTVGYMSPEQVRGLAVDHRSDIFSFGAILYEMLSGQRAFKKATPADTMSAILNQEPPELNDSRIPVSLDHVVKHCLEKDRDRRFQSARDIQFALTEASGPAAAVRPATRKGALVGLAIAVAVAIAAGVVLSQRATKPTSLGPKRIAVLPFENLGAPEDDYFSEGMSDEVRGKLTSLATIQVIARASSMPYKKSTKTPQEIANELGVGYLLMATVRRDYADGRKEVVLRPELVEVGRDGTATARWQQPFKASLTGVFQVQSEIAARVADELGVVLGGAERRTLSITPTQNAAAYEAFLQGESVFKSWSAGFQSPATALTHFERAVALDPKFARAWAGVSRASSWVYDTNPSPSLKEKANQAAAKALTLAPEIADPYLALSDLSYCILDSPAGSLEPLRKARDLAPGNADILVQLAYMESSLGRMETALESLRQAERLDPRSPEIKSVIGSYLLQLHRIEEARKVLDEGLALAPESLPLLNSKAFSYAMVGDLGRARAVIGEAASRVDRIVLVSHMALSLDSLWLLDDDQLELLLRLPPTAFPASEWWGLCLAQASALRKLETDSRTYARQASVELETKIRAEPQYADGRAGLCLALAYLNRKDDAIRECRQAMVLVPATRDYPTNTYYRHLLARALVLLGESDKAIDEVERILNSHYVITPGWLRIDPNFAALRGNPRFEKLIAQK